MKRAKLLTRDWFSGRLATAHSIEKLFFYNNGVSFRLLHLCLALIYFQYNGKHYKHLHGTAMGFPYFRRCGWNSHAKHWGEGQHTLSNYLTKRLTILLQSLPYEPWRGEHNLFATHTTPCIRRTSETVAGLLRPYNIRVAHKPMFSLRRLITYVTNKDKPEHRPGAVIRPNAPTARPAKSRWHRPSD